MMLDLSTAPRVWKKNGVGVGVRIIDPAWVARQQAKLAAREDEEADRLAAEREFRRLTRIQAIPSVPTYWHSTETIRSIIATVAEEHGVSAQDILSSIRNRKIVLARQHAIHEVKARRPGLSLPQIGRAFGRDHTTVLHSLRAWPEKAAKLGRVA